MIIRGPTSTTPDDSLRSVQGSWVLTEFLTENDRGTSGPQVRSRTDGTGLHGSEQQQWTTDGPDGRDPPGYGSGGWGFESLAARYQNRSSAALLPSSVDSRGALTATKLRPLASALSEGLLPAATTTSTRWR